MTKLVTPLTGISPDEINMEDQHKSKEELIRELNELRRRLAGMEAEVRLRTSDRERDESEEDQLKSQKIESLGILAGGIAHEFNNILTAIIGNLVLAKMYAKPELEVYDILTEAEKAALRAENLSRQLLTFSKGNTLFKRAISLSELLRRLVEELSASFSDVRFELVMPVNLRAIEADEGQLRQALKNLLINAVQAMSNRGVIKIRGENMGQVVTNDEVLLKGKYVKLEIEDQGHGIEVAFREKIFDPFFTTRRGGSGLGLTSADSIIRNHGGFLTLDSAPGSGTTFIIYLPQSEENAPVVHSEERVYLSGQSRVLVMEDEQMVRTVLERMLDQCGCGADFTRNGQEMIERYRKAMEVGKTYDAVIIDLVITEGMGGKEAVVKLLEMDPNANAIVSSGYSDDLIMANFRDYGFRGALTKPYNIAELGQVLREVITSRAK